MALHDWARTFKRQTLTVYYAARDPRTPFIVRLLALAIAAYALSPIDLIPDFIPVIGYLDDLILLPLGIALVIRLTPPAVIEDAQIRAEKTVDRPISRGAAIAIVTIWLALGLMAFRWLTE